MQTVLHVATMRVGQEGAVRQAHNDFPIAALERGIGIERLVAFIGSGLYALELTVADGDFQENFHRFLRDPDVQRLFTAIQPHVSALPEPESTTGSLPLASAMMLWQSSALTDATTV